MELSVGYGSIYNRRYCEEIQVYREPDRGDPQRGSRWDRCDRCLTQSWHDCRDVLQIALLYGVREASGLKRVKELKWQLSDYKTMVTELTRDNRATQELNRKKAIAPTGKREAVDYLVDKERRPVFVACQADGLASATYYKKPAGITQKDQPVIIALNQAVGKYGS